MSVSTILRNRMGVTNFRLNEAVTVAPGDTAIITTELKSLIPAKSEPVSAYIDNYNTSGINTLTCSIINWYSSERLIVINCGQTSATLPKDMNIKIFYMPI